MNPAQNPFVFRLARSAALLAGALLSLLAIYQWLSNVQRAIQQPMFLLPDNSLWNSALLAEALAAMGLPDGFFTVFALAISLLFNLAFLVCGWLILWNRHVNWFGLYLGLVLLMWADGVGVFTGFPPPAPWLQAISTYLAWIQWPGLFLITYFFPSGHVVPRWARVFAGVLVGLIVYGLIITAFKIELLSFQIAFPLVILCLLVGGYAQIYRYKHSGPVERQQVKWVVLALLNYIVIFVTTGLLINLTTLSDPAASDPPTALIASMVLVAASSLAYIGLPVSIAFALLRYRLWDIDVVVRKTLQYTLLTGVLAVAYFGSVVALQNIFGRLTGERNSPLITVISTLGIAALFSSLRRRTQGWIDRRFFRSKYNAEKALAGFAETARAEVDMEKLASALVAVALETMRPDTASLWIKPNRESRWIVKPTIL